MTYLNQFHKESTERMMKKMDDWKKSPTSSLEAVVRMKANLILGRRIEQAYMMSKM